jgi:hypothetical protein
MKLAAITIALALVSSAAIADPLPQPKPGTPGGSCPHAYVERLVLRSVTGRA